MMLLFVMIIQRTTKSKVQITNVASEIFAHFVSDNFSRQKIENTLLKKLILVILLPLLAILSTIPKRLVSNTTIILIFIKLVPIMPKLTLYRLLMKIFEFSRPNSNLKR